MPTMSYRMFSFTQKNVLCIFSAPCLGVKSWSLRKVYDLVSIYPFCSLPAICTFAGLGLGSQISFASRIWGFGFFLSVAQRIHHVTEDSALPIGMSDLFGASPHPPLLRPRLSTCTDPLALTSPRSCKRSCPCQTSLGLSRLWSHPAQGPTLGIPSHTRMSTQGYEKSMKPAQNNIIH